MILRNEPRRGTFPRPVVSLQDAPPMARPPSVRRNRTQADEKRLFLGGRGPPTPPHRVSGWGNPVAPCPRVQAAPAQTLPPGGRMGKPGFPIPLRVGGARPTLLRAGVWGNLVPPYSRQAPFAGRTTPDANGPGARATRPRRVSAGKMPALPAQVHLSACGAAAPLPPSPRWGEEPDSRPQRGRAREGAITFVATDGRSSRKVGKPGFPLPLRAGCALSNPPAGGEMGEPGSPLPLLEGVALPNPPVNGPCSYAEHALRGGLASPQPASGNVGVNDVLR